MAKIQQKFNTERSFATLRKIIQIIKDHDGITKPALSAATGISKSTVEKYVWHAAKERHLIHVAGNVPRVGKIGRPHELWVAGSGAKHLRPVPIPPAPQKESRARDPLIAALFGPRK